jgi:hypothetical protein
LKYFLVGAQRGEGDGGHDGKEYLRAQPDDERQMEDGAKDRLHAANIHGRIKRKQEYEWKIFIHKYSLS